MEPRNVLNKQGGWIAAGIVAMLGFCLWALVFREVPAANQNALLVVIGILSGAVGTLVNFYFGSTSGSKKSQDIMADQASTIKTAQGALAPLVGAADASVVPIASVESLNISTSPTDGTDSEPKQV